ncbi:hypothetical protein M0R72_08885 [Candidatus Pacearchaeota archaeon]|jgi:hypothetical protein|nr:hypothetical protein [Candidatus Pacearchaeota archaeon]
MISCTHCEMLFEPTDGRNTVCPACRPGRERVFGPTECGGCGRSFTPTDGRQRYCSDCAKLPIAQRKNQMRRCPTCGTVFMPTHGSQQLHCRRECAWPDEWDGFQPRREPWPKVS